MKIQILPTGGGHNLVVDSKVLNTIPYQKSDCMRAKNDLISKKRSLADIKKNFFPVALTSAAPLNGTENPVSTKVKSKNSL